MRSLENVVPTGEQLALIRRAPVRVEIIRGAAGSGKTTTAILKLNYILNYFVRNYEAQGIKAEVNALVLTYNRTLQAYVSDLAAAQNTFPEKADIEVSTFASWARSYVRDFSLFQNEDRKLFIAQNKEGISLDKKFLTDEIDYISGRFLLTDIESYYGGRRRGRGRAPQVNRELREKIVNNTIIPMNQHKAALGKKDWYDLAVEAIDHVYPYYDIVIIDEAQDFTANQLRAVAKALNPEHSLVCVIDTAQRIYPGGHTWAECGIDLQGRVDTRLSRNYRNTKKIAKLAHEFVKGLKLDDDGSLPDIEHCEEEGELPKLICGTFSKQIEFIVNHIQNEINLENECVGILFKSDKFQGYTLLKQALNRAGIPIAEISRQSVWPNSNANVVLSTMHSSKGLEFDHVIMPGLAGWAFRSEAEPDHETVIRDRRLLGMAVGRARATVVMGCKQTEQPAALQDVDIECYERIIL